MSKEILIKLISLHPKLDLDSLIEHRDTCKCTHELIDHCLIENECSEGLMMGSECPCKAYQCNLCITRSIKYL